jgi:hypothetical protein
VVGGGRSDDVAAAGEVAREAGDGAGYWVGSVNLVVDDRGNWLWV